MSAFPKHDTAATIWKQSGTDMPVALSEFNRFCNYWLIIDDGVQF